jgi:hypothetical protein
MSGTSFALFPAREELIAHIGAVTPRSHEVVDWQHVLSQAQAISGAGNFSPTTL